jgi:hypothetical protein
VAVRRSLEEPRVHALLELLDVPRDRWLTDPEGAGGAAQASRLRHREEHPQIVPVHGASLATPRAFPPLRFRIGARRFW